MRGRNSSADFGAGIQRRPVTDPLPLGPNNPGAKATNPGGLGACVREDLMDLLIERNQLG
jgi:hypothetical protein